MLLISGGNLTTLGKAIILLLALWALAIILPDYSRIVKTYGEFGFEANNNGLITSADSVDAKPPIVLGSQIDFRKTSRYDLAQIYAGMAGLQYTRRHQTLHLYLFDPHDRAGVSHEHTAVAADAPVETVEAIALFADQTLAVFFILLATFLVWEKPSAMTLGFFLYALWFNPGQAYVSYVMLAQRPDWLIAQEILQALATAFGYVGFAIFALRFPEDAVTGSWRQRLYRALPFAAIYFLVLQLWSFGAMFGLPTERVTTFTFVSGYVFNVCVVFALRSGLRHQHPIDRQRTRWVIWGCIIGLPAFIFADSNESTSLWNPVWNRIHWSPSETVLDCFFMISASLALAVAYAVLKHRVIDVRLVLRRAVARTAIWLAVGVVLIECILQIEEHIRALKTAAFVTLIISVSLLFEWLHERINDRIDEVVFRSLQHAAERLEKVDAAFDDVTTLDTADRLLIDEPTAALELASAAVFRLGEDGVYRQVARGIGWSEENPYEIAGSDPVVTEIKKARRPVPLRSLKWKGAAIPTGTAQPVIAIPIRCHNDLAAIAMYGLHSRGDDLEARESDLLEKLCRSASAAYDNIEEAKLRQEIAALEAKLAARSRRRRSPAAPQLV